MVLTIITMQKAQYIDIVLMYALYMQYFALQYDWVNN